MGGTRTDWIRCMELRKSFLMERIRKAAEQSDPVDTITVDVPLFIRLLEFAREDARTDMELHVLTEKAIALSRKRDVLTMEEYHTLAEQRK